MEDIETAVGEDDAAAEAARVVEAAAKFSEWENFLASGEHQRGGFAAGLVASLRMAPKSSSRVTVAVPRFMTTMPPA